MYDARLATQIIGALILNPDLLSDTDKYILTIDDFEDRLHRIIFSSIYNLYHDGMNKIDALGIIDYLKNYPELDSFFKDKKGVDFLVTCTEITELKNFSFYYRKLKKISLLRNLKSSGYDVSHFYVDELVDIGLRETIEERFERSEIPDIIAHYTGSLHEIESKFINKKNFSLSKASDSLKELKEKLKIAPEMGYNLNGEILTTVAKGGRRAKFYLNSAGTGAGKSRTAMGHACRLAYPFYYDTQKGRWIEVGANQKVLFISTELDADEVRTVLMAYLSGVDEDHILTGKYIGDEERRVDEAISIMEHFEENFIIYHLPDPNINQLNTNVRRLVIHHHIDALFYDYIHSSAQLISEFSGAKIREDVALLMMSTALKNLANEMQIFVWSSTQLNGSTEDLEFGGPHSIRGSRAIADKTDFAMIMRATTPEVLNSIKHLLSNGYRKPNAYSDIYKNRRSKYVNVRLWSFLDLSTGRIEDLFLTDPYGTVIEVERIFPKADNNGIKIEDIILTKETGKLKKIEEPKPFRITL